MVITKAPEHGSGVKGRALSDAHVSTGLLRGQIGCATTRCSGDARSQGLPCVLILLVLLVSSPLFSGGASAADRARPFLIGELSPSWGPTPATSGLRDGLLALGYREYEQFDIGVRFTQGDITALFTAAQQLVQYGVDLIFAGTSDAAQAAQGATKRIPIVFTGVGNPVKLGLIQSFARPGGNITGVTGLREELNPKRLEFFRAIYPDLKRVLYPYDPNSAISVAGARVYREAARRLDIVLVERPVRTVEEARATLAQVRAGEVDGILQPPTLSLNIPGFILEATVQQGIPSMFDTAFYAEQGALATYGSAVYESGRLAARLVDKIFKGADPAEIPVEANSKIEFVINLKTAKAMGLAIAPEVLFQADKIVR